MRLNDESLETFFKANENKHDFIKNNLLNATLTFYHRVKMFIKHIIMGPGNPMAIQYFSYKVEFAMRGAGHIHGVLWVDWSTFTSLPDTDVENIKKALEKIKNEEMLTDQEKQSLADFADLFISCSLKNLSFIALSRQTKCPHISIPVQLMPFGVVVLEITSYKEPNPNGNFRM